MKRLTKWIEGLEQARISCEICGKTAIYECWSQENCTQTAVDRLASIEDILGDDYDLDRLEVMMTQCMSMREEVSERFRITGSIPVERLRELVEADKAGRCVVLPVKPGDTVWYLTGNPSMTNRLCFDHVDSARVVGFYFDERGMQVRLDYFHGSHGTYGFYGKTVFSTREAAEAALAKEK